MAPEPPRILERHIPEVTESPAHVVVLLCFASAILTAASSPRVQGMAAFPKTGVGYLFAAGGRMPPRVSKGPNARLITPKWWQRGRKHLRDGPRGSYGYSF